jgi:sugar porter (SP) family MFS transporter
MSNKDTALFVSSVAALGGLLFGFDTAIISGAIPFIQSYFHLHTAGLGWAVSCILIGCATGAIIAGKLADRFGRRFVLLACALCFAASGIGAGMATTFPAFIAFRILGGLGVGAAAMVSPMYIAETVPADKRGGMVALYQMAIVTGILLAYGVDYVLNNNWRWIFASQAIPATIFFILLCFVSETPRWLISKGYTTKAEKLISKMEIVQIQQSFADHQPVQLKQLFQKPYAKVMLAGIAVAVFQQISGINAVLYYAPTIFKETGLVRTDALFQTILMGAVNVLATLIAICYVDRFGRKKFLLIGSLIMGFCLLAIGLCFQLQYFKHYLVLVATFIYVAAFACTLGAVTWVYLSEIFPNRIRGLALSIATLALWVADFVVSYAFPIMTDKLGTAITLAIYAICCGIAFLYFSRLPETKGRTLEQMDHLF